MKRILYITMLLVMAIIPTACTDSNNYVYNDVDSPAMLSFGFYKADNPGVLGADYVVDLAGAQSKGTSTQNISVAMPPTVEKTSLVARFTTSDGTTVRIGDNEQVSQTTVNDFTFPIDYILTKGNISRRYEVTVVKSALKWMETGAIADVTVFGDPVLKLNPVTQKPYIGFKIRAGKTSDAANHSVVYTLADNNEWQTVGGDYVGHLVNSSYFDFDIAPDGTPYVAYSDQQATVLKNAMSVMEYNGTSWEFVGTDAGLLNAVSNYVSFAALDGELVGAQLNNSSKAGFPNRTLVVSNYKNGAWNSMVPPMLTNNVYMVNAAGCRDAAYVISINRGAVNGVNYGYNVLRYTGGEWTAMITNYLEPGNTTNNIAMIGITVSHDGTPYIWTMDDASGQLGVRIKYYDKEADAWATLGGNILPLGFEPDRHTEVALDVAPNGTPYVVYTNDADLGYPYLMYLDPETNQWSAPSKLASEDSSGLNIKFTNDGIGYVTFVDGSNHLHTLRTYE